MNQLITLEVSVFNGVPQPTTTSKKVADVFGKRHSDVVRAIENLECSSDFKQRNFANVLISDKKNNKHTEYSMAKDGFVFLAMGFTGKRASEFKEAYIKAFNAMELELKTRHNANQLTVPQALQALAITAIENQNEIKTLKERVTALEGFKTITTETPKIDYVKKAEDYLKTYTGSNPFLSSVKEYFTTKGKITKRQSYFVNKIVFKGGK
jgi:Rha family phage regulatory protein